MDAEMLATEDIKIEMEEFEFQAVETVPKLFAHESASWKLSVEFDDNQNTRNAVLDGTALYVWAVSEHNYAKPWVKSEAEELKVKSYLDDSKTYPLFEIKEELIIKDECNDDDTFLVTDAETFPDSTLNQEIRMKQQPVDKEPNTASFFCQNHNYSVSSKHHLISRKKKHRNHNSKNTQGSSHELCRYSRFGILVCIVCIATFKSIRMLDDHIIKKHPAFIEAVSSEIHECTHCTYKTSIKRRLDSHMLKHTETGHNYKTNICIHCKAKFINKVNLSDHIIKNHPEFIASVSCKIHQCTHCKYKTTIKHSFTRHMLNHPKSNNIIKSSICIHCNAKFTNLRILDDHIIKKHPDFIDSVSTKIHECMDCKYKTNSKSDLGRHLLKHSETGDNYKFRICIHCKAKFRSNTDLDDHIIKKHPDFIASVSCKIHECPHCAYKTTFKRCFVDHMLIHPESADKYQHPICNHCNAKFRTNILLYNHIIRKHPDFISSIPSKIHECTHCSYKTTIKGLVVRHMLKHSETGDNFKFSICIHCKAKFTCKTDLDDHIIKKHPDFIASVSCKMHECPHCAFKTTLKSRFAYHMLTHPEFLDNYKYLACNHCNAKFKSKVLLNDHIIRKHPDLTDSVSKKIHKCTDCEYKTTFKHLLARHMLKHSESGISHKCSICVHCKEQFKNKRLLNEHIIRIHPDFIASVHSKIHECPQCTFKTIMKGYYACHMLKHSESVAGSSV